MNENNLTNRKMTSDERKMRILEERYEIYGKEIMDEWCYYEDDFKECCGIIISGYIVG